MEVILRSYHIIHLLCHAGSELPPFFCSLVYGLTRWREKEYFWDAMQFIEGAAGSPCVCGNFNYLICQEEKRCGTEVRASSSRGLAHFMESNGYVDLGYDGGKFIWSNRQTGMENIQERIDRGIISLPWGVAFSNASIHHHSITLSDHTPIIFDLEGTICSVPKPFKFEGFFGFIIIPVMRLLQECGTRIC